MAPPATIWYGWTTFTVFSEAVTLAVELSYPGAVPNIEEEGRGLME